MCESHQQHVVQEALLNEVSMMVTQQQKQQQQRKRLQDIPRTWEVDFVFSALLLVSVAQLQHHSIRGSVAVVCFWPRLVNSVSIRDANLEPEPLHTDLWQKNVKKNK